MVALQVTPASLEAYNEFTLWRNVLSGATVTAALLAVAAWPEFVTTAAAAGEDVVQSCPTLHSADVIVAHNRFALDAFDPQARCFHARSTWSSRIQVKPLTSLG